MKTYWIYIMSNRARTVLYICHLESLRPFEPPSVISNEERNLSKPPKDYENILDLHYV